MGVGTIILRRILILPPLLIGLTLILFLIANLVPGDPVAAHLGQTAMENEEIVKAFRKKWGLDQPLHIQYLTYLGNLLHGDMGVSLKTNQPVAEDIARFFPASVELGLLAIFLSILVSFPLGVISAVRWGGPTDYLVRVISLIGLAAPVFWLALVMLYVFYLKLGWLPGSGRLDTGMAEPPFVTGLFTIDSLLDGDFETFKVAVRHLVLPAIVLSASSIGLVTRMVRSGMLEVLGEDYTRTARSKGLSESIVVLRHALPNAMIPAVTVLGLTLGYTMVGAVLTETIFSWPGIGRYGYNAVISQDFPAMIGVSLVVAVLFSMANLLVDVLYIFLDPRMRTPE